MQREEHYIDQLFKDHFEDFEKSPSDEVWKGVVKEGTMANGKRFGLPGGWKSGVTLLFSIVVSVVLLSGSNATSALDREDVQVEEMAGLSRQLGHESTISAIQQEAVTAMDQSPEAVGESLSDTSRTNSKQRNSSGQSQTTAYISVIEEVVEKPESKEVIPARPRVDNILKLSFIPDQDFPIEGPDWTLSTKAKRDLKEDLFADTYYKKPKGGHWFVTGGLVLDSGFGNERLGFADGLAFGAGKYLNDNAFMKVSLRGVWDYGFTMRATYTQLLLPGKVRPFVQGGLAWGERLDLHMGVGVMYEPSPLNNWRIFAAVNYENARSLFEDHTQLNTVLELGVQMRLSGTEPLISDNNWMNSVPHYEVPRDWYLEGSSNFAFFDKTKVTRISFYAGKNLDKRLFVRGGVRLGRDRVTLPAQLQYHAIVRRKLRVGIYGGPSLDVTDFGLGAELGVIAYYEVKPGWSLFVAPVLLDNSEYNDRIFETGLRYYLGKKK